MPANEIPVLTEIATEILVNELKRRAIGKGMTVADLLADAKEQWDTDESENERIRQKGHEGE